MAMERTDQVIGEKYRLVRLLGEGGMGSVYEAQHTLIGRRCAVKFLHPELARQHDLVTRFVREAQAASAIGHRGIIDIYDVGTTPDGAPYLVMEFLDGVSVASRLEKDGCLPTKTAVEIVAQTLSALSVAHQRGIVHRDLKPDNLYLVQTPGSPMTVKILDFGISKMTTGGDRQQRMTQTGAVLGTPVYMAPEQAAGQTDIDHRLDIYAMGVILFELLTGCVPFSGTNYNQILVAILSQPFPPIRTIKPDLPEALEAIIFKATARDRRDRFPTAEAMLHALLPLLDSAALVRLGMSPEDIAAAAAAVQFEVPSTTATSTAMVQLADRTATRISSGRRTVATAGIVLAAVAALVVGLFLWAPWADSGSSSSGTTLASVADAAQAAAPGVPVEPVVAPLVVAAAPVVDAGPADTGSGEVVPESPIESPDAVAVAPEPPPVDAVTIDLQGLPEGAKVVFDGVEVAQVPFQVEKSSIGAVLEIEAPGFRSFRDQITPDKDITLTPRMRRAPAGTRPPATTTTTASASPPTGTQPPRAEAGTTVQGARGTEIQTSFQ
ncbi:MAG: serine/threonine protein kinase [Deltaproteobacteria bacterium]|nr:serine/threonine protein kinase [Deltaproteobacteria bacterium]